MFTLLMHDLLNFKRHLIENRTSDNGLNIYKTVAQKIQFTKIQCNIQIKVR